MANRIILVTASYDNTVQSWDVTNPTYSQSFHHQGQVNALLVTKDKQHIVAAGNPDITVYRSDATPPQPVRLCYYYAHLQTRKFVGHTANVTGVGMDAENKWMYSSSEDKTVKVWDWRGCVQYLFSVKSQGHRLPA